MPEVLISPQEQQLATLLAPTVERLHDQNRRHEDWVPVEFIPAVDPDIQESNRLWIADGSFESKALVSALTVNLGTEENLPHYFRSIVDLFGKDSPFEPWAFDWTAQEGRHAPAIFGYILARGYLDPVEMEKVRMAQVRKGEVPHPENIIEAMIYTSFQELATKIAHARTGQLILSERDDQAGKDVMDRVALDEGLHYTFYSGVVKELLKIDPNRTMIAIEKHIPFLMPGTGIRQFKRHSLRIAQAEIFGAREMLDKVILTTLRAWKIIDTNGQPLDIHDLNDEGKKARDNVFLKLEALEEVAQGYEKRWASKTGGIVLKAS